MLMSCMSAAREACAPDHDILPDTRPLADIYNRDHTRKQKLLREMKPTSTRWLTDTKLMRPIPPTAEVQRTLWYQTK